MKRYYIIVTGKVQGVDYRDFVRKKALSLNLTGYVRNTRQGTVEIVAEGEEWPLKKLVEQCRKGPLLAKVDTVDVKEGPATQEFEGFDYRFS